MSSLLAGASAPALLLVLSLSSPLALAQAAPPDDTLWQDVITISGDRLSQAEDIAPQDAPASAPDAAALLARLPGIALINNGALSGQVQARGLFGPRVAVRIDGQGFASGGPNLMDPPLHYAPLVLVERLEISRGPAPVRAGPSLGASVNAIFKTVPYANGPGLEASGDVTLGGRTGDSATLYGGVGGIATDNARLFARFSKEEGGDIAYPGGKIASSGHERLVFGLGGSLRFGDSEIGLDLRRQETGETGNPPFPMDIQYFDTDTARLTASTRLAGWTLNAQASLAEVAHLMNNYSLRPSPAAMQQRASYADATTRSGKVEAERDGFGGQLRLGIDTGRSEHKVRITNPNNAAFFLVSIPDAEMTRTGGYAEWSGPALSGTVELGVRVDRHDAQAGLASVGTAVPMGPRNLANAFNGRDRTWKDTTVDGVFRLVVPVTGWDGFNWRFAAARKSRVPGYLERFGWLPTNASGGLADGNIYVGDLTLDPEISHSIEIGFDWQGERAYLRPVLHVAEIDGFIQGVPFDASIGVADTPQEMVAAMNGDPTPLRFANTDARIWGAEADFGLSLNGPWRLDGVASYVRGDRTDINDALYRIAPSSLRLTLTYEGQSFNASLEALAVADQDRVSRTNSEVPTDGHLVFGARADLPLGKAVHLSFGIDNLFDETSLNHLGGYNQIAGSDVGLGARLPGSGRSGWVRLNYRFGSGH